ncbi:hypothetical protein D049_1796B, partial [Vibrio parahaemolyticus VPTS-2010]
TTSDQTHSTRIAQEKKRKACTFLFPILLFFHSAEGIDLHDFPAVCHFDTFAKH